MSTAFETTDSGVIAEPWIVSARLMRARARAHTGPIGWHWATHVGPYESQPTPRCSFAADVEGDSRLMGADEVGTLFFCRLGAPSAACQFALHDATKSFRDWSLHFRAKQQAISPK